MKSIFAPTSHKILNCISFRAAAAFSFFLRFIQRGLSGVLGVFLGDIRGTVWVLVHWASKFSDGKCLQLGAKERCIFCGAEFGVQLKLLGFAPKKQNLPRIVNEFWGRHYAAAGSALLANSVGPAIVRKVQIICCISPAF